MVAAPLLVLAAPVRLLLRHLPRDAARRVARALRSRPARVLAHPAAGLAAFAGTLAVVHLPAVYDLAERTAAVHAVAHGALFWSAVALWVPVLAPPPVPHRTGAVARVAAAVGAMAAMAVLGAVLSAAPEPLYAAHRDLADQREAGAVMWVAGMVVAVPLMLAGAWAALSAEERRQEARL